MKHVRKLLRVLLVLRTLLSLAGFAGLHGLVAWGLFWGLGNTAVTGVLLVPLIASFLTCLRNTFNTTVRVSTEIRALDYDAIAAYRKHWQEVTR